MKPVAMSMARIKTRRLNAGAVPELVVSELDPVVISELDPVVVSGLDAVVISGVRAAEYRHKNTRICPTLAILKKRSNIS